MKEFSLQFLCHRFGGMRLVCLSILWVAAQLLLYSNGVGSLSWKSLLSEMMAFLYISRTTSQRKLPVDAKKKWVPVSSFPVLCAHIVQIWWFIGWAVCGPFLQQQDGGQGGMRFCLFCRMILSGVVRTFFLNCCRIRGRVVWWWEMRSSHIDHALQIQYGDRLDV